MNTQMIQYSVSSYQYLQFVIIIIIISTGRGLPIYCGTSARQFIADLKNESPYERNNKGIDRYND